MLILYVDKKPEMKSEETGRGVGRGWKRSKETRREVGRGRKRSKETRRGVGRGRTSPEEGLEEARRG